MRPHPDHGFAKGLLFGVPLSLAVWAGFYFLWKWVFAWLGGAQ